jgi:hypothetical protein
MESIADHLNHLTICADFHLERAQMIDARNKVKSPVPRCAALRAEGEPSAPVEAPAEPEFTYEVLKAKLIERGVDIPKGTKMTTLTKLWSIHKDAPVASVEDTVAETVEAEVVAETPAEPDPFDAPAEPAKPAIGDDLLLEDARALIEKHYDRSESDKANLIAAFSEAGQGICNFGAIPQGKYGAVVRKFLELKGVSL